MFGVFSRTANSFRMAYDADAYCRLIYPLDESRSGRDLIDRVVSDVKVSGESLTDDMPQRFAGAL
jgi:hypothetical protein